MKSSALKKVVIQCSSFWKDEINVDSEIFDDIFVEAATRAVEKRKNEPGFQVAVVIECWEKKHTKVPNEHHTLNTYFILVNAGMQDKAEMLRLNFKKLYGIDLQRESMRGENNGSTPNPKLSAGTNPDTGSGTGSNPRLN